jgi:DNA-directed RNA polymerase specialized sigma24 family protein
VSEIIETIYKDERYYKACLKITNGDTDDADDLFQHTNIRILEKERAGKFHAKNLYSYYFVMAKRDYFSNRDKFARTHRERLPTTQLMGDDYVNDITESVNEELFQALDDFARSPSKNKHERFIKDVYLEVTKPDFEGISKLAKKTNINIQTFYSALYRFRELFYNNIDPV